MFNIFEIHICNSVICVFCHVAKSKIDLTTAKQAHDGLLKNRKQKEKKNYFF